MGLRAAALTLLETFIHMFSIAYREYPPSSVQSISIRCHQCPSIPSRFFGKSPSTPTVRHIHRPRRRWSLMFLTRLLNCTSNGRGKNCFDCRQLSQSLIWLNVWLICECDLTQMSVSYVNNLVISKVFEIATRERLFLRPKPFCPVHGRTWLISVGGNSLLSGPEPTHYWTRRVLMAVAIEGFGNGEENKQKKEVSHKSSYLAFQDPIGHFSRNLNWH